MRKIFFTSLLHLQARQQDCRNFRRNVPRVFSDSEQISAYFSPEIYIYIWTSLKPITHHDELLGCPFISHEIYEMLEYVAETNIDFL